MKIIEEADVRKKFTAHFLSFLSDTRRSNGKTTNPGSDFEGHVVHPQLMDYHKTVEFWKKEFQLATDFDRWGQPVEAIDHYQKLSSSLANALVNPQFQTVINLQQKECAKKILANIDVRIKSLKMPETKEEISLDELKKLESKLIELGNIITAENRRRLNNTNVTAKNFGNKALQNVTSEETMLSPLELLQHGSLLPHPKTEPGKTYLTVKIEKIGLKYAFQYIDPFLTISVKDASGIDLSPIQSTPPTNIIEEPYIIFDVDVIIQNALETVPNGFAIFFEFRHYKPRKQIISTKCFALLEKDEIKSWPVVLELYKKPTDFQRRHLRLMTIKPLYLYLHLTCNTG